MITILLMVLGLGIFLASAYIDHRMEGGTSWASLAWFGAAVSGVGFGWLLLDFGVWIGLAFLFCVAWGLVTVILWWLAHAVTGGRFIG